MNSAMADCGLSRTLGSDISIISPQAAAISSTVATPESSLVLYPLLLAQVACAKFPAPASKIEPFVFISSVPIQATIGDIASGLSFSKNWGGVSFSVMRDAAAGHKTFVLILYIAPSWERDFASPMIPDLAAP